MASSLEGLSENVTADGEVFPGEANAGILVTGGEIADAVFCDIQIMGLSWG